LAVDIRQASSQVGAWLSQPIVKVGAERHPARALRTAYRDFHLLRFGAASCPFATAREVALGPDSRSLDSHAADFAMTLGEFYCKGLPRRCWWNQARRLSCRARL